ncbi:MAG: hypothetical protein ACI4EF_07445 [Coprococcus sp.]
MKKKELFFLWIAIAAAVICIVSAILAFNVSNLETFIYCAICFGSIAIIFFIVAIVMLVQRKRGRELPSSYATFAVVDIILMACICAYAVYNIMTDTSEWFPGLFGIMILITVVPVMLVCLIADGIIFLIRKHKKSKQ